MSSQKLEDLLKFLNNNIQHDVELIEQSFKEVYKQDIKGDEKEQINFVIARLTSFLLKKDKYSYVSSAKSLLKYLHHDSPLVKQLATSELCMFLRISTLTLIGEKSTNKIEKLSKELELLIQEISESVNEKDITIPLITKIQQAIRFANLGLAVSEIGTKRIDSSDEVLNSTVNSSIDRLISDFNLIDLLQKYSDKNTEKIATDI